MGIDLGSIFGGHHGGDHHDTGHDGADHHDTGHEGFEADEAHLLDVPLFASGAPLSSAHAVGQVGHTAYPVDALGHHGTTDQSFHDHRDHPVLDETPDLRPWHSADVVEYGPRLHMARHSEAIDSNHDGVSDAASRDLGLDPDAVHAHQPFQVDYVDRFGRAHHGGGRDSDGDGFADALERAVGTDPHDASSHPTIVEAHHFPAGSDENLPGTIDVVPSDQTWRLP